MALARTSANASTAPERGMEAGMRNAVGMEECWREDRREGRGREEASRLLQEVLQCV